MLIILMTTIWIFMRANYMTQVPEENKIAHKVRKPKKAGQSTPQENIIIIFTLKYQSLRDNPGEE